MTSCCQPIRNLDVKPVGEIPIGKGQPEYQNMAVIPSGEWQIGSEASYAHPGDYEGPVRTVQHASFLLDPTAVTNGQFAKFVAATGYITEAEQIGWSFVFYAQVHPDAEASRPPMGTPQWWLRVDGACWNNPDGGGSNLDELSDHPVVHVSWNDAQAYSRWAGKRLPTEMEWEIAAKGGMVDQRYPWGDELTPDGQHRCNIWQGRFPLENSAEDGFLTTAPVASYEPNNFGLFNMVGNVWEWTSDSWLDGDPRKSMRGGSYLCHESYCNRYRVSARTSNMADAAASHLGFRCAADVLNEETDS